MPKVVIPEKVNGKLPLVCVLTGRIDDVAYFRETFTLHRTSRTLALPFNREARTHLLRYRAAVTLLGAATALSMAAAVFAAASPVYGPASLAVLLTLACVAPAALAFTVRRRHVAGPRVARLGATDTSLDLPSASAVRAIGRLVYEKGGSSELRLDHLGRGRRRRGRVRCPCCEIELRVRPRETVRTVRCPACRETFRVAA